MLKCRDNTLYTGVTRDIKRRLGEHNGSRLGAKYTRARRPVVLVYQRGFRSKVRAMQEEYRIKSLRRSEKLVLVKNG